MKHPDAAQYWTEIIVRYDASDFTLAQFVEANQEVKFGTLQYWRKKLNRTRRHSQTFFEVDVQPEKTLLQEAANLQLMLTPNGVQINISEHTDMSLIRRLVDALC